MNDNQPTKDVIDVSNPPPSGSGISLRIPIVGIKLSNGLVYSDLQNIIHNALGTNECHHKQWYIEQIALVLGISIDNPWGEDFEKGIAP